MPHTLPAFHILRVAMTRACLVDLPFVQFRGVELCYILQYLRRNAFHFLALVRDL